MYKDCKLRKNSLYGMSTKLDKVSEYPAKYADTDSIVFDRPLGEALLEREYSILRCYVIPHSSVGEWIAGKYKSGYRVDIDPLEIPRCDIDGVLAAMGVVSYEENESETYLTGYGIELMKQGLVWLEPQHDQALRKYYSIK